ncbi:MULTISPECIES: hypothetical protein [unclassified Micromonospora]|uniref:hypothetical protein n=1 Tax=unclassified Micromonospora TaxID=2617518 RepID=UPI0036368E5A
MPGAPAQAALHTSGLPARSGTVVGAPDLPEAEQPAGQGHRDGPDRPSPVPSTGPVGPASAVGIRLLDAPVNRRDDPRAHKYIVDHVRPGTTIKRRVVVENLSEDPRPVAVYAAAADVTEEGFVFAPGRTENELSSWIDVSRGELRLAPDEESEVLVTIEVPRKAEAGERYAVVWAEVAGVPGQTIRNVGRVGVRVYLSVGPGGEPPSGFEIGPISGGRAEDGAPIVTAEVRNTGQRALDLGGDLRLTEGPGGLSVAPVKVETTTLALGGATTIRVALDRRLPDGPWTVRLDLASGWTKRSANGTVRFGGAGAPAVASAVDHSGQVLTGGLVASGLVLVLLGCYAYRRRARGPAVAAI